jgi:hypothetical protein
VLLGVFHHKYYILPKQQLSSLIFAAVPFRIYLLTICDSHYLFGLNNQSGAGFTLAVVNYSHVDYMTGKYCLIFLSSSTIVFKGN